ncbi:MAG: hypothetical protein QM658_13665 [Gordonia sp. (in: high G+C Gram-positive bacteria)]
MNATTIAPSNRCKDVAARIAVELSGTTTSLADVFNRIHDVYVDHTDTRVTARMSMAVIRELKTTHRATDATTYAGTPTGLTFP